MSQRKRKSRSGQLPDVSTASVRQLTALPAEVLRLHLANHHLVTTGTKTAMAQQLFDALHTTTSSTPTSLPNQSAAPVVVTTQTTQTTLVPSSEAQQLSSLLQLLSQALQQNLSTSIQHSATGSTPLPTMTTSPITTSSNLRITGN